LALVLGLAFIVIIQVTAEPVTSLLAGGDADAGHEAEKVTANACLWLRIAALGAPGILLTLAGNGWMRGVQDTRRPLRYVLGANLLSALLAPVLVYPVGMGLAGSAVANVIAQWVCAALFLRALVAERVGWRPQPALLLGQLSMGRDLILRTLSIHICFLSAAAVAARISAAALGGHQIVLQLWMFSSLVLDAVAVAAQSLVGADLGAGRTDIAQLTARRVAITGGVCGALLAVVVAAGSAVIPELFTSDPMVVEQAMVAWPWFVGMLPVAGVVFALDGVLIGAGDVRYMRNITLLSTLGGFLPMVWLAYALQLGLGGIWGGLALFILIRLGAMLARLVSGQWAVPGATRSPR